MPTRPPRPADRLEGVRARLRTGIDQAAQGGPTLADLTDRLRALGITVRPNLARTGRLAGLRFEAAGLTLEGSELGRDYSWSALAARHGVHLDGAHKASTLAPGGQVPAERPAGPGHPIAGAPIYRAAAVLSSRARASRICKSGCRGRRESPRKPGRCSTGGRRRHDRRSFGPISSPRLCVRPTGPLTRPDGCFLS